jgi:hypothetical protein
MEDAGGERRILPFCNMCYSLQLSYVLVSVHDFRMAISHLETRNDRDCYQYSPLSRGQRDGFTLDARQTAMATFRNHIAEPVQTQRTQSGRPILVRSSTVLTVQ